MPTAQPDVWGTADAYERYMGRWSRQVAPLFTAWLDASPQADWIDIGCGTGVLTTVVLATCAPSHVTAIDSAPATSPRSAFDLAPAALYGAGSHRLSRQRGDGI